MKLIKKDKLINFINNEILNIENFEEHLNINLKNKHSIKTALLIGADGRDSFIRDYYNIKTQITDLEQKAVTFITFETAKRKPKFFVSYYTPSRSRAIYVNGKRIELDPNDKGGEHE